MINIKIKIIILIIFLSYIFIKKNTKYSNLKVLLCSIAKNENKYIKEFVNHYRKLKFKKIILYDNNNIIDKSLEYILKRYIKNKFVEIINFKGFDRPQAKAFNECYKKYNNDYDWISFFDVDEFLYLENFTNIKQFLSLNKFKKCQSIIINWKYYGDNNKLYYENKPLNERFTVPFYFKKKNSKNKFYYSAGKSIIRGKIILKVQIIVDQMENY